MLNFVCLIKYMNIFKAAIFLLCLSAFGYAGEKFDFKPCPQELSWRFGRGQIFENLNSKVGVVYKEADNEKLCFDISYPKSVAPESGYPLLFYIHGGAWVGGERFSGYGYFNDEIRYYNQKGFAVASVDYRFARFENPKRTMDCCVVDCMDALRFIVKNAKPLNVNPEKIGIYGHSAGGHLAFMLAMADQNLFLGDESLQGVKYKVACAVPQSGPVLFGDEKGSEYGLYFVLFGKPYDRALMKKLSPINYVKKDLPPMLILHGKNDELVPIEGAELIKSRLEAAGAPVEAVFAENARHSFEDAKEPNNDRLADIRRAFFVKHLGKKD